MNELRTVRLIVAYDGTDFHGWQAQPGRATVQRALGEAIAAVTGEQVVVHGSGRTDAGVHALGQVAHIQLSHTRWPAANLLSAINSRLPVSVRVLEVCDTPSDFHARHSARGKLYRYRMYRGAVCPPLISRYVYHHPYPLDEMAMARAAPEFEGEHDFTSFASGGAADLPPSGAVRTVLRSVIRREGPELVYDVEGRGFLHHMVRNMAGYLLEVGRGRRPVGALAEVLAARRRGAAAATAPARGLCLMRVDYSNEVTTPESPL